MKKTKPDGSKTIYAAGGAYSIPFGDEVDKTSGGTVTRAVTYYPAGGATLAPHCVPWHRPPGQVWCSAGVRINITSGSNSLYYILKDHLGSASVVTNSSGAVVGEQRYYPFGETRLSTGSIFTDQLFTGQREMTGLGIYHFNARFYSPKLGRFLSADTIVPNPANPQDLNRFAYVRNNPLRYIDPTGNRPCGDGEKYDCDGRLNPITPSGPKKPVVLPPTPGGGGGNNGGNNGGGGGVVFSPSITPPMVINPPLIPLDPFAEEDPPTCPTDLPDCELLTPTQRFGWGVTLVLIDVAMLAPLDIALAAISIDGALACLAGVALACLADIPLAALDYAVSEVTVSTNVYMATSIANGYKSDFEWVITSNLIP